MNKTEDSYIEHEVRIRMVENAIIDINKRFESMETEMRTGIRVLLDKIDSNFHWTLGIMFTFMGGIILHMAKLI